MRDIREWGSGIASSAISTTRSFVVVGLAIGRDEEISVGNIRNGTYRDAVSGRVVGRRQRQPVVSRTRNSAGIYVLDGPGKIGEDGDFLR